MSWLGESELRVGLGCMRLSTDEDGTRSARSRRSPPPSTRASRSSTPRASYGDNERAAGARASRRRRAPASSRREACRAPAAVGCPDGRAKAIRADCEASLEALDGLPIDLYLLHAPDPRTPWRTSVRALARLVDDGLVRRVGVANVNLRLLDEALELAPIAAVQVPLSPFDVAALARRRRRAVQRARHRGDRALAARRTAPRRASRAKRGARRASRMLTTRRPRRSRSRGCCRCRRRSSRSRARAVPRRRARPPKRQSSS